MPLPLAPDTAILTPAYPLTKSHLPIETTLHVQVLSRGRTKEDLERCMGEYEELDVWQVNADRTIIRFVGEDE